MTLQVVIANKLYSSWSLRPWLVMRAFDIPFEEHVIALRRPETKAEIAKVSPSGKVPALIDGETLVWESLAIIEYLAEKFPQHAIWPRDMAARAHARAISNEMHGGFLPLRQALPMNLSKEFKPPVLSDDARANIARIEEIWKTTRERFCLGRAKFLYTNFSAADAMFAPVVSRLDTYHIPVAAQSRDYMDAVLNHPAFIEWKTAALKEPWEITDYEAGHEAVVSLR